MLLLAQIAFFVVAFVATYVYWIRPILHSRPAFKHFHDQADGVWSALALRFAGIKTLLVAAVAWPCPPLSRCTISCCPTPSASTGHQSPT
jgi:hypothetical protein